ncbi:MAG TPA: polysaccharide deacetylase family protein [Casimicrobiaceae bacterium]|nr:polysaccharide deacetylase family protein [Casimicrobiaceae bacterium]
MNRDAIHRELDRWHARGRRATLWLRDDDACRDSAELRRLLALANSHEAPVAIAAIPASLDATLVDAIERCPQATIVQHGYAHRNHAATGEGSAELGDDRDVHARLDELARGRERFSGAFGDRFVPILVPPWNRAGEQLLPHLGSTGFVGLSRFGARATREAAPGVAQVNAHVDAIAWRRDRRFIGEDAAIERIVAHLSARREGACDASEPTGFLMHHLVFDESAFDFVDMLLDATRAHPAAEWLDVAQCFGIERAATSPR